MTKVWKVEEELGRFDFSGRFGGAFELFSFWMSSVPLMYLGTKIGVRYLQKRRINRWREEELKR